MFEVVAETADKPVLTKQRHILAFTKIENFFLINMVGTTITKITDTKFMMV
jgi:hypothetical protein